MLHPAADPCIPTLQTLLCAATGLAGRNGSVHGGICGNCRIPISPKVRMPRVTAAVQHEPQRSALSTADIRSAGSQLQGDMAERGGPPLLLCCICTLHFVQSCLRRPLYALPVLSCTSKRSASAACSPSRCHYAAHTRCMQVKTRQRLTFGIFVLLACAFPSPSPGLVRLHEAKSGC